MAPRTQQIVDFPVILDPKVPQFAELVEILRRFFGKVVSLGESTLLSSHAGVALTAASSPGTALIESKTSIDLADAGIDQARLVGYGSSTVASQVLRLNDTTGSRTICSVTMPTSAGRFIGDWTSIPLSPGDRAIEVAVVGNGVATQTLYRVAVQWRTAHRA